MFDYNLNILVSGQKPFYWPEFFYQAFTQWSRYRHIPVGLIVLQLFTDIVGTPIIYLNVYFLLVELKVSRFLAFLHFYVILLSCVVLEVSLRFLNDMVGLSFSRFTMSKSRTALAHSHTQKTSLAQKGRPPC